MNSKSLLKSALVTLLAGLSYTQVQSQCSSTGHYYGTYGSYGVINNVTFNTLNNSTSYSSSYPYVTTYSATGSQTTTVYAGLSYTLSVNVGSYSEAGIWVDWDGNGSFNTTNEYYYMGNNSSASSVTYSQTITVPSGASAGNKNMRVRTDYYGYYSIYSSAACNWLYYGETEEYTVNVQIPPACSGTPSIYNTVSTANPVCSGTSFTLTMASQYNYTGMTYQWQSSSNGTSWTNISGATSATYTGSQTAATYYRCVVTCTNSSSSVNSNSIHVTMNNFLSCYCAPTHQYGTYGVYGGITNVALNQLNNTSAVNSTSPFYTEYSAATATTVVLTEQTYELAISSTGYNHVGAWIDWNQDGTFGTTEFYYLGYSSSYNSPWVAYSNILVPANAVAGMTKMRIRTDNYYNGFYNTSACGSLYYGESEDYFITVAPTPTNDAGIEEIISPSLPTCDFAGVDLIVALNNWGTDTLHTCTIKYQINGGTVNSYSFSGAVGGYGNDTAVVNVGNTSFSAGDEIVFWTENPNGVPDSVDLNDTASVSTVAGLEGTYSIPGDFTNLQEAADSLAQVGVCGDVILELATGTYTAQTTFWAAPGANEDATITITSETGNAEDVILEYVPTSQANNWTVRLDAADWYNFDKITMRTTPNNLYGVIVRILNGSDNNTITNCEIIGSTYGYTGAGDYISNIYIVGTTSNNSIVGNNILYGGPAIYAYGGSSSTSRHHGLTVTNNTLDDQYYYTTYLYYVDGLEFHENVVTKDSLGYPYGAFGLYMYYCDKFNVTRNFIGSDFGQGFSYPLYAINCVGNNNPRSQFANNCIFAGSATATSYGYYGSYFSGSGLFDFYNNSVTRRGSSGYYALYVGGGGAIRIKNNSLADLTTSGYAMYVSGAFSVSESDYNNFYSNGANPIYFGSSPYASLAAYQTATGNDMSSVQTEPNFQTALTCITCNDTLNNAGTVLSTVSADINDEPRSVMTPDIGATEYVTPATFTLGPDDTICGSTAVIEAGPAQSITWNVGGNSSSDPSVTLNAGTQATTFNVSVNITTEYCGSASDLAVIRLIPDANLDSTEHICAGATTTLTPGGNGTYAWSNGATTSTLVVDEAGVYSVTKLEEGCTSMATTTITQSEAVEFSDIEECLTNMPISVDATISNGTSYAWSGGSSLNTATNTLSDAGPYSVTATDAFGCTSSASFNVSVLDEPTASIAETHSGVLYVFDASGSLSIAAGTTYFWDFGYNGLTATTQSASVLYPWSGSGATSYTVTLTVDNGCGEDVTTMTIAPDPLGVEDIAGSSFVVYPNPTEGLVTVQFGDENQGGVISLIDISGRTITSTEVVSASTMSLDLSAVAAGSYTVKYTSNGVDSFQQIVVR